MVRVMTLLAWWQLRNAVRTTLTDYRKLIPLLAILFFIATQALSSLMLGGGHTPQLPHGMGRAIVDQIEGIRTGAFLMLALISIGIIDYGFTEGFMAFSMADVDYLFPSPVPRRLILAYRLAAKTAASVFQASFLFYFLVWRLVSSIAPQHTGPGATVVAFLGLLFCLGGYASLAFALKMIFGFGQAATVRRWIIGVLVLGVLLTGYIYWQHGLTGLTSATQNRVVMALFYPCWLAGVGLTAPLIHQSSVSAVVQLAVFYIAATVLLFTRNENFYEASLEGSERHARLLAAAREQNWSTIFTIQSERKRHAPRKHPYSIPPFGRGGMALLWANLSAAAKRPVANFWGPLVAGVGIAVIVTMAAPPQVSAFLVGGVTAYLLFILTMSSMALYRQSIGRQPLIRPLPFQPWQVVLADVIPRTLMTALFVWGSGLVLFFSKASHAGTVGMLLTVCVPAALLALNLVQFMLALWYPDIQDKLQQMMAGFISLFLTTGIISVMAASLAIPLLLRVPPALAAIVFLVPTLVVAGLLLLWASYVYRRFQPKQ